MNDVWFDKAATSVDLDACLDALSLRDRPIPPLLAVMSADGPPRLLLASKALFGLFGVASGEALSARLLGGQDPGGRRLETLSRSLPLDGAPRLERLRFFVGPGTEIITFLCRRIPSGEAALFVSAALGVRAGLLSVPTAAKPPATATPTPPPPASALPTPTLPPQDDVAPLPPPTAVAPLPAAPMSIQAIQARLRESWPAARSIRFLWQSDADLVCTQITPQLAEIVGPANAGIVGRSLLDLAPEIDASGGFADALRARATWSGLDVLWPIADAAAAVTIGLGAIPAFDRDHAFEGYRGYGVIHTDRVAPHAAVSFAPAEPPPVAPVAAEPKSPPANVVAFPGGRALSPEDEKTFVALGAELREEAGLDEAGLHPALPEPDPQPVPAPEAVPPAPTEATAAPAAPESRTPAERRAEEVGRHGLAMLDRLALGLLVSRDNIPIFANRHLLDMLGFADEDALHAAGGLTHLFGGQPGNVTGSEAVGVRGRDGTIVPINARMQTIDWDGLPATLLTLQRAPETPRPPVDAPAAVPVEAANARSAGEDGAAAGATDGRSEAAMSHARQMAELRELHAILETATDGVAVIDADCNVTALNRSGEALFGCDRSAVIGKPFLDLFAPHARSLAADYLDGLKSNPTKRLLNDGREIFVNAQRGGAIPVFMTMGRLDPATPDEDGTARGPRFCALFRDLTHWKKVEQDLEAAKREAERVNALKSDFLAKVSHEVRTPLNAIIGFAEVMMEERFGPVGNERYIDYLRDIHASGSHVMSLVNDLLDLSKIEAGKMELAVDAIDANRVIGECVAIMQPQASRERVIMRLSLAPTLPQIKGDERSLRQIVLNLLSNAVKFNEPGGQVIVASATTETGHVVIRIRDTGPGMSEADIAAALEPFRQLSTARSQAGGTGLGLPLTKALVEANQASFTIRSKVNQGTLVEVSFPPARVLTD